MTTAAPIPFTSADEAYLWAFNLHRLQAAGHNMTSAQPRPCLPIDILVLVRKLREAARLEVVHVRCIEIWATAGRAPAEGTEPREVWDEAMAALEWPLTNRGWVVRQIPRPRSTAFRNR